jgi:hypothetical protein
MIGGIISNIALTLLVLPVLYMVFGKDHSLSPKSNAGSRHGMVRAFPILNQRGSMNLPKTNQFKGCPLYEEKIANPSVKG